MHYGYITINEYYELVILKSNKYYGTNIVRKMTAGGSGNNHYDIIAGTPLSISHLISLILYCNFSDLCTKFSSTFRKENKKETLESIKTRNGNYWHLSKYLREVVEVYGKHKGYDDNESKYDM
eukprot:523000_1